MQEFADVVSCAQIALIQRVELSLGSSRVIRNVHIFTHPGDTKGDTKFSTVFVSTQPMTALASSRGEQFAAQVSDEIADLRVALFVRCLRHGRLGEFLEARIVPKWIEHWIEPEQRRSERYIFGERAVARH